MLHLRIQQARRAAIGRAGYRETPRAGLAARADAGRGRGPAGHFLHARRNLLASAGQGFHADRQQPVQRLAHGGCLARPVNRHCENKRPRCRELRGGEQMDFRCRRWVAGFVALSCAAVVSPASAQKPGGTLRMPLITSPASMSIHEESTIAVLGPIMGVFNNLVMFDQQVPQNSLSSIVPDLAESWNVSEDGKELTFKLRQGVKWHDGKPFTAKDVKCTWDLLQGKAKEKLRLNAREAW